MCLSLVVVEASFWLARARLWRLAYCCGDATGGRARPQSAGKGEGEEDVVAVARGRRLCAPPPLHARASGEEQEDEEDLTLALPAWLKDCPLYAARADSINIIIMIIVVVVIFGTDSFLQLAAT